VYVCVCVCVCVCDDTDVAPLTLRMNGCY
jgi:hypothetical protein